MNDRVEQLLKGNFFSVEELKKAEEHMSLAVEEAKKAAALGLVGPEQATCTTDTCYGACLSPSPSPSLSLTSLSPSLLAIHRSCHH